MTKNLLNMLLKKLGLYQINRDLFPWFWLDIALGQSCWYFTKIKILIFVIEEAEGFHQLFQREPLQQGIHGPLIAAPQSVIPLILARESWSNRPMNPWYQQRKSQGRLARRSIDFLQQKREEEAEILANEIKGRWKSELKWVASFRVYLLRVVSSFFNVFKGK